jgi:hypothetical protein
MARSRERGARARLQVPSAAVGIDRPEKGPNGTSRSGCKMFKRMKNSSLSIGSGKRPDEAGQRPRFVPFVQQVGKNQRARL